MLRKIETLNDLAYLAKKNTVYAQVSITASNNLGGPYNPTLDQALKWLEINALEIDEESVIAEINDCIKYHQPPLKFKRG